MQRMTSNPVKQERRRDRELTSWRAVCSHPNVVDLYACFDTPAYFCFAMEVVTGGSLKGLASRIGI